MSDLLTRLCAMPSSLNDALRTMDEAADCLEVLEKALERIRDDGRNCVDYCRRQADRALARAALDKDAGK